jgi:hypothetical protein
VHFLEERRRLVIVDGANPLGLRDEVDDAGPAEASEIFRPNAKHISRWRSKAAPSGSHVLPSNCTVYSPFPQSTTEHAPRWIRLGQILEVLTVSKMIWRSGVMAMPTSADWGVPFFDEKK